MNGKCFICKENTVYNNGKTCYFCDEDSFNKGKKQGALEELKSILKESEIIFERDNDFRELYTDLQIVIDLRIKELSEKEEKE